MTTRDFILLGERYADPSAGTVVIDGTTVFSGAFNGPDNTPATDIATGTYTVDDVNVWKSVVVTLVSGQIDCGFFQWNGIGINNPKYTPEQLAVFSNHSESVAERVAVYTAVDPTLTAEEISVLNTWPNSAEQSAREAILTSHDLWPMKTDWNQFASSNDGVSPTAMRNVLINGEVPAEGEGSLIPYMMHAGDVLTYETFIFAPQGH